MSARFLLIRDRGLHHELVLDVDTTQLPPDFWLDLVSSVAIIIYETFWIIMVSLSGYSVNACCRNCCYLLLRRVQCSENVVGFEILDGSSWDSVDIVNLSFCINNGNTSLGWLVLLQLKNFDWSISLHEQVFKLVYASRSLGENIHSYLWLNLWDGWTQFPSVNCSFNVNWPEMQYRCLIALLYLFQNFDVGWCWLDQKRLDEDLWVVLASMIFWSNILPSIVVLSDK